MGKYLFSSRSRASVILLFLALLFGACAEEPAESTPMFAGPTPVGEGAAQELAFETIGRRNHAGTDEYWTTPAPALVVLTAPEDSVRLDSFVDEETQGQLLTLDYGTHFSVAIFLGHFVEDHGQEVEVEQVLRRGNQVALYAHVSVPDEGEESRAQEVSPYHVISIAKDGVWNQEIEFALYLNGEVAVTETHFIP